MEQLIDLKSIEAIVLALFLIVIALFVSGKLDTWNLLGGKES